MPYDKSYREVRLAANRGKARDNRKKHQKELSVEANKLPLLRCVF